jgi:hypothetical protein
MFKIRVAWAGITAGMVALFTAVSPGAEAAPRPTTVTVTAGKSVCDTGYRGQPEYDAKCLRHGTRGDAAKLWFDTPEGKRGHLRDDFTTRRSICKYAPRHGGVRAQAKELVNDMAYDTFRNWHQMIRWAGDAAQGDCLRMGYSDPVSGLVVVNLRHLPKGDCWVEVSYADHKRKINTEVLCKG